MNVSFAVLNTASHIVGALCDGGFGHHVRIGLLIGIRDGEDVDIRDVLVPPQQSDALMSELRTEDVVAMFQECDDEAMRGIVGFVTYYPGGMSTRAESEVARTSRLEMARAIGQPMIGVTINELVQYSIHT